MVQALDSLIIQLDQVRYITCIFFLYIFKDINIILFAKLRHKQIRHYLIEFWLTLLSTLFSVLLIYKITEYFNVPYSQNNPKYQSTIGANIIYDSKLQFNVWLGMIVAVQWVRVFMVFQTSPTFGKVVEIIINMLTEISKFMIILTIILISFSSAGRILFFDMNQFSSDDQSIIYLISAALGNFDYSIYNNSYYLGKYYGYTYLTLYLLVISITLLNFLIAILAEIYTTLKLKAKGLHSRQILLMRSSFDDDPYYSSLILLPVPMNFMMIPFTPFVAVMKSRRLNTWLTYMCYTPVMLISMFGFACWSYIYLPFAYLISVWKIWLQALKVRKNCKKLLFCLIKLAIFLAIGPFYYSFIVVLDIAKFSKSLFDTDNNLLKSSKVSKDLPLIDIDFIKVLIEILKHYDSNEVETKQIIYLLQTKLKIIEQVIEICYKKPQSKHTVGKMLSFIFRLKCWYW